MFIPNKYTVVNGARWFIRRGPTTSYAEGFRTLDDAQKQIDHHKSLRKLIRQYGYTYRVKGDAIPREIVNRLGELAQGHQIYVRLPAWR